MLLATATAGSGSVFLAVSSSPALHAAKVSEMRVSWEMFFNVVK